MISIHLPLAGQDEREARIQAERDKFQSTCPLRGKTITMYLLDRTEASDFNPLAPCGARPNSVPPYLCATHFNPLAPCGARPPGRWRCVWVCGEISIHLPLAGQDTQYTTIKAKSQSFQSTCPLRGKTNFSVRCRGAVEFQSTCPLRGKTRYRHSRFNFK